MENWLKDIQNRLLQDRTIRLALAGGVAFLFLIVIVDAFGARERSAAVRETLREVAAEAPTATVPSVNRVPRDLASERALAADATQVPSEPEVEIADADATEIETAQAEVTEAEATVAEVEAEVTEAEDTGAAMAEAPALDAASADAPEQEVAETVATEDAVTDEEETTEIAQTDEGAITSDAEGIADDGLALLAGADLDNGQRVWRQCAACHVYETEQNRGGPHLVNIIGRDVAAAEGWRYSRALQEHGGVWSVESLLAWLENPDSYIPGNQMAFRGLRNEQDRIDVLGLLSQSAQD